MGACVIDASAVLAFMFDERGGDQAEAWMDRGAAISTANVQEVVAKLTDEAVLQGAVADAAVAEAERDVRGLVLDVIDLTWRDAVVAGGLIAHTKPLGLSAGDRCCIALGLRLDVPIVHAEHRWHSLGATLGADLVLIRGG